MEEHIWNLVELYLSGEASTGNMEELRSLLVLYPSVYLSVKEFLLNYQDPDPRVSASQISAFLVDTNRAIADRQEQRHKPLQTAFALPLVAKTQRISRSQNIRSEAAMGMQFLKIALRNLQRNKSISFINITGLGIGIASAVLILLWVQNQYSYDQFHQNKSSIYQLINRQKAHGEINAWPNTPIPMAPAVKAQFAEVKDAVRINWVGSFVLKYGSKQLETEGFTTDPGFLKVFSFPLLKGNAATALNGTHSIVLTQKLANKLFGTADPMGKIMAVDSTRNFIVTGVLKDLPNNTTFNFEYLVPWSYMKEVGWENNSWDFSSIQTFVQLKPGVSEQRANNLFKNIYRQHGFNDGKEIFVHPLSKWWLYSKFENGRFVAGQAKVVHLFEVIALLIMLIACINYMNLGTARSARRAKEVGIRKVSGAGKGSLIKQFLGESVLIAFVAGLLGLCMVYVSLPFFNTLIGKELTVPVKEPYFWLSGIGFILFTGLVAGSYPAFYLSAFKPVNVLKGTFKGVTALIAPRKVLVVMQFTLAIVFIICTTVVYRQIKYAQTRDTGYDVNNLVYIYMKGNTAAKYDLIKNELQNSGAITQITRTNSPVLDIWTDNTYQGAKDKPEEKISFAEYLTDKGFTQTMNLPLLAGRDINVDEFASDTAAVLINQEAAKRMGFANPIGQNIKSWAGTFHIVGVVKNFVAGSPYRLSMPAVIQGSKKNFGTINLRLNNSNSVADNLSKIAAVFKKYNPDYPFNYSFLDDSYKIKFSRDHDAGKLAAVFSGLTIFISCLGLFALAACMAENRVKEIGIRKVLGASVTRIATLLTKDFLVLVLVAFVIASPIAWWLMSGWLQGYQYRVNISWWIFGITGVCALIIAISTVGYQALKAATSNPVKSLRSE
ncbi:ABC transporter permease [Mucilaginibacter galii]|uniref:ABC transporter permease n=1 Tax=Mucilaginibacter galii TaxID=2005073 RepID=A0A917J8E8_9SPHI|nr:ABC transporter permease [Mucilaginibacter galii]GGI50022.1 ABC transporter permease [Mucilaginibacter galii]